MEIIDISDPTNPTHVSSITDMVGRKLSGAHSIFVSGRYAYVASLNDSGVEIIDISDPASPIHVGSIGDTGDRALGGAKSIYVSGKYAYVAAYVDDGVEILDISDPANPTHKGAIFAASSDALLDGAGSIYVSGRYAYVAAQGDNAVTVLDISDPENPTHVSSFIDDSITKMGSPKSIYISGQYAYIASGFGFEILNISDPENLTHAGSSSRSLSMSTYVSGKYAYIATKSGDDGIDILDISGIDAPTASIGSIAASTLEVSENAQVGNNLQVNSSLNVGPGGIKSDGPVSITRNGADDDTNAILKLCRTNTDPASTLSQGMFFYGDSIETENVDMYINHYSSGDHSICAGDGTSGGGGDVSIGTSTFFSDVRLFVNGYTIVNGDIRAMDTTGTNTSGNIHADGNITADGTISEVSDARLKENIRPIESALDKVNRLQGVYFDWLDSGKYDDRRHVGVIAQETEKIFPEVVFTADDDMQTLSVNYTGLVAPLIEAVKELSATVETLRDENTELRTRIENLESKN